MSSKNKASIYKIWGIKRWGASEKKQFLTFTIEIRERLNGIRTHCWQSWGPCEWGESTHGGSAFPQQPGGTSRLESPVELWDVDAPRCEGRRHARTPSPRLVGDWDYLASPTDRRTPQHCDAPAYSDWRPRGVPVYSESVEDNLLKNKKLCKQD